MATTTARDARFPEYSAPISDIRELKPRATAPDAGSTQADAQQLTMTAFGATDRGLVRENNEDQFVLSTLTGALWIEQSSFQQPRVHSSSSRGHLLIVADGMGGHASGEEASHVAVAEVESFSLQALTWLLELRSQDAGVLEELKAAMQRADLAVTKQGIDQPKQRKMGTTLTIGYTIGNVMYVAHAGDSRCYLLRGGDLVQITRDHNVAGDLAALGHPELAGGSTGALRHVVTNVVGGGLPGVRTEVHKIAMESGDAVLFCTDGLTEMVSDDGIAAILEEEPNAEGACQRLIVEANRAGGRDNITAIVARFNH